MTHAVPLHPTRRIRRTMASIAVLLTLVALTGCSRARDLGAGSGASPPAVGQPADRDASAGDEAVAGGAPDNSPSQEGGGGGRLPEDAPPGGGTLTEQIVRTGDVTVDVEDITSAANRITAVVDAAGGDIGSDQRQGDSADGTADLVLRVPPDSFDDVLETVSALGEELSRSVSAEDVRTVVADVDARVQSLQNSVDRLLALAAQAVSVSDLIAIESELSARQSELESLQAQQRALADQVSLATLSVRLSASSGPPNDDAGFLASLAAGWNALLDFGTGLISVVGVLLPWLAVILVLGVPLWLLWRRRRSRPSNEAAVPSAPAMATFGPAPAAGDPTAEPVSARAASEPTRPPE
ncbi:MAG: DUF4349 domain-containing protein [Actinomycetota bacterium]|nr:DUF4349 domain-containing protein [Actinomycetota bacterium]